MREASVREFKLALEKYHRHVEEQQELGKSLERSLKYMFEPRLLQRTATWDLKKKVKDVTDKDLVPVALDSNADVSFVSRALLNRVQRARVGGCLSIGMRAGVWRTRMDLMLSMLPRLRLIFCSGAEEVKNVTAYVLEDRWCSLWELGSGKGDLDRLRVNPYDKFRHRFGYMELQGAND
eukprot:Rmarinus@m.15352